jgi:hypothetical protein
VQDVPPTHGGAEQQLTPEALQTDSSASTVMQEKKRSETTLDCTGAPHP